MVATKPKVLNEMFLAGLETTGGRLGIEGVVAMGCSGSLPVRSVPEEGTPSVDCRRRRWTRSLINWMS